MADPAPPSAQPPSVAQPTPDEQPGLISVISWKGVGIGSLVTLGLGLALGRLTAGFFETNLGAQASLLFASMFVGAFIAGKIAGRMGRSRASPWP
jgi:hypothetical protein